LESKIHFYFKNETQIKIEIKIKNSIRKFILLFIKTFYVVERKEKGVHLIWADGHVLNQKMHIQIGKTLVPLQTEDVRGWKKKVLALTFSPDNKRLAVISSDRYVAIFDDNGDLVDRFSTKPNNQGQKNYSVRYVLSSGLFSDINCF